MAHFLIELGNPKSQASHERHAVVQQTSGAATAPALHVNADWRNASSRNRCHLLLDTRRTRAQTAFFRRQQLSVWSLTGSHEPQHWREPSNWDRAHRSDSGPLEAGRLKGSEAKLGSISRLASKQIGQLTPESSNLVAVGKPDQNGIAIMCEPDRRREAQSGIIAYLPRNDRG